MKKVLRYAVITVAVLLITCTGLSATAMAPSASIISEDYIPSEEVLYTKHYATESERPKYVMRGYQPKETVVIMDNEIELMSMSAEVELEVEEIIINPYEIQEQEYPIATEIWKYLTEEQGFNKYVTAGIMGNLMAEVGGQTLNLDHMNKHGSYYGMAQWNVGYYPGVVDKDLRGQLDFLMSTIEQEFTDFGYISGYSYEEFLQIEDEQAAALAFAQTYERCGDASYSQRKKNATNALEYFNIEE